MKKLKLGLFALFMGVAVMMSAQTESELYQLGLKYKKEVDNVKMLQVFKKLYDIDAKNQDYLANLSFAYSKVGSNLDDAELQLKYYAKAKTIASDAKAIKAGHAFSHYAYALALARENEDAKTKVKIANAKEIKLLITLDASLMGGFLVKTNSQVIDLSVKGQLSELAKHLDTVLEI